MASKRYLDIAPDEDLENESPVHGVHEAEDLTAQEACERPVLGEPPFPPIFPALANALYQGTGKRLYEQPFAPQIAKG